MKSRFLFEGLALGGDFVALMPAVQTNYASRISPAYEGMVADSRKHEIVSRTVETAAGIGFGKVAVQGTTDYQVRVAEAGRAFIGVTEAAHSVEGVLNASSPDLYPQYANIPIVREGPIWVQASVAVTPGQLAYFVPATGVFTNVATANTLCGRWETSTSGAGLAVLWVFRPQV